MKTLSTLATLANRAQRRAQKGFTMIELLVVIAIVAVLALIGIPLIQSTLYSGRVEPTATDISKVSAKIRSNYAGTGATPYSGMSTSLYAQTAKGLATALTTSGTSTFTLGHDLGASAGQVTAASASAGAAFAVTVAAVNDAACPGLSSVLSKGADVITINGTSVKASGATYSASSAQTACTTGDTNSFVFTFN